MLLNIVKDAANVSQTLFSTPLVVAGLIDAVSGVYNVYKFLEGDKPKNVESIEGGMVKVENNNGNINYYDFRIYNMVDGNQVIRGNLAQGFDTLNNDFSVAGRGNNSPVMGFRNEE